MKSRIGPLDEDNDVFGKNNSMELQPVDQYSVDPYDLEDDDDLSPEQNLERHLPSRSASTRHGTVRRRPSSKRRLASIANVDEVIDMDQENPDRVESVKAVAAPMQQRREMKNNQPKKVKHISCWKSFKLQTSMAWQRSTSSLKEFLRDIELWKGHLKQVEGRFGNGVVSYFYFLKWMLFLNLLLFIFVFGLLGLPTIIAGYHPSTYSNISLAQSTNSCVFGYPSHRYTNKAVEDLIVDFVTGQGWINTTIMFYSNYPSSQALMLNETEYNLPLAYVLVGGVYFFLSLLLMVKNLTQSFEESYIEGGGTFYSFCNKVFAAWDYCIVDENTANVKSQNIYQDINAELAEEERQVKVKSRTTSDKVKLYLLRGFISFLVIVLLGGAIYAIYFTVGLSTDPTNQDGKSNIVKTIIRSAPSLTITALNLILPPFFQILSQFEDWSPRFEVALNLWRTVLLRLASVAVLMITLYEEVGDRCTKETAETCCRKSWENEIASQMYMLIWIDLFVVFLTTAVLDTIKKLLHKHTKIFRKLNIMPEFQIPKNVLDLVYGQCLIWIGTFFSPLIPAMGVVKLFFTFYLKKVSLMYNNKPSNRPYQGSRSNYLFTVLLLITFFICLVAVGWGITKVRPSCHGPFRNDFCTEKEIIDILGEVVDKWPTTLKSIINYIGTAAFIFPGLMIFFLLIYYFRSMIKVHLQMIEMLKDQLVLEGRDKRYLMEKLISSNKATAPLNDDHDEDGSEHTRETHVPPTHNNVNF